MANVNDVDGVPEIMGEPIPEERVIDSMSEWNDLLNDPSRSSISTLNLKIFGDDQNESLLISGDVFIDLKSLIVNNTSCGGIRGITITGLDKLESVRIGNSCFNMLDNTSKNAIFKVTHCRNLKTITVGEHSLKKLKRFEVFDNPCLETITWGNGSFDDCAVFSFSGTLVFFHYCFREW